jgi:SPP1 family predicted phage head-tail adaptor
MESGRLRDRVTFYREVKADDGYGGETVTRKRVAELWAEVKASAGGERLEGGRPAAVTVWKIVIRKRSDIVPTLIAVWKGVDMNVRQVAPHAEDLGYLAIIAETGVAP